MQKKKTQPEPQVSNVELPKETVERAAGISLEQAIEEQLRYDAESEKAQKKKVPSSIHPTTGTQTRTQRTSHPRTSSGLENQWNQDFSTYTHILRKKSDHQYQKLIFHRASSVKHRI